MSCLPPATPATICFLKDSRYLHWRQQAAFGVMRQHRAERETHELTLDDGAEPESSKLTSGNHRRPARDLKDVSVRNLREPLPMN